MHAQARHSPDLMLLSCGTGRVAPDREACGASARSGMSGDASPGETTSPRPKLSRMRQLRPKSIAAAAFLLPVLLVGTAVLAKKNPSGGYAVKVVGEYNGQGTAQVTASSVSISATVVDENGQKYALQMNLPIANGRFLGQGSLGSLSVNVSGRVDGGDPVQGAGVGKGKGQSGKPVLTNARISVLFISSDGHVGRIVGDH